MAYTLDTAAATDRLTAAGVDADAARAIVTEMVRSDDAERADLVTKADLEAAILALEVRLVKWAIGIGLAIAGLLFAALRFTGG